MDNFEKAPNSSLSQNLTTEDLLKSQTVGLVNLSDFRKRRAEVLEQKERESQTGLESRHSILNTPSSVSRHDGSSAGKKKKKQKTLVAGRLSFALENEDDVKEFVAPTFRPSDPNSHDSNISNALETNEDNDRRPTRRLGPRTTVGIVPKALTKSALSKEAKARESLRKEYLVLQERVKETEFKLPFTFYDGTSIPGGVCRMKKGDHIWLFLDRSRKVGAELGVGGGDKSKREWARVGVDDLMLVRGEIIIPHHFDFYYFIVNKVEGFNGLLFEYSAKPLSDTEDIEGADADPSFTKVVDRRWYERNKHIFPASIWEEFDPSKDYTTSIRKDAQGNTIFLP